MILLLLPFVFGCGGSNFTSQYTGTWSGTNISATTFSMTLYQNGSTVNGEWIATGTGTPLAGTFTGTTSGSSINSASLVIATGETTSGTLTGTLTLNGSSLTGTLTGTLNSSASTVTLTLTQQQ